ncbi:MAG: hypothetical protein IJ234_08505 [Clostridia bacterium]|nr:hypothetical protein [Clostridia bacterium]
MREVKIETQVEPVALEIEGEQYAVAPRTVQTEERLNAARALGSEGEIWRAELEALLGWEAVNRLFVSGEAENLDRMEKIRMGALQAYGAAGEQLHRAQRERAAREIATALAPINELLRRARAEA